MVVSSVAEPFDFGAAPAPAPDLAPAPAKYGGSTAPGSGSATLVVSINVYCVCIIQTSAWPKLWRPFSSSIKLLSVLFLGSRLCLDFLRY